MWQGTRWTRVRSLGVTPTWHLLGSRQAPGEPAICEGVKPAVPEEVTLALGSEEQTGELAGGREQGKMTYREVPRTAGPFWNEERRGHKGRGVRSCVGWASSWEAAGIC